ncbi:MAG: ATP-binding cassette domain-containing protein [Anaerolineae bacterium]|nr:MAG: ATP-binding cassette domain-containing protein [Anaerolineae bacterium]
MTAVVIIENLHYAYPPFRSGGEPLPVLKGVNLSIGQGEFVAIMGPTGAGKTTLCLALNGIVPHSMGGVMRGNVLVAGLNTKEHRVADLAQRVGLVFQDAESQLFNMTVEDEVAFGPESLGLDRREIGGRVEWALRAVRMEDFRHRSPFQLSGGQKQRVAIAAILAMQPQVLVLDEPTAGLDPVGKHEVFAVVQELKINLGMTIVLVEQDSERIAEFAERVVVLNEGRAVLDDEPRRVFSQVERMHSIGLAVPQVSELAHRLNAQLGTDYAFITLDDAFAALNGRSPSSLEEGRSGRANLSPPLRKGLGGKKDCKNPSSAQPCIVVKDVWYHYEDEAPALIDIDLDVADGDYVAVIGQNGSGKTTLVKHFNGLLKPTQGQVTVEGQDTRRITVGELSRRVGYVFQNPDHQIFAPTTREEIAFGPRNLRLNAGEVEARVEEALSFFGLKAYAEVPPAILGYGLRRKVTLASVVAMRPRILVLDEPTNGLDWRSAMELMERLAQLQATGHTIILITHDMRLAAQYAARSLVLHNGRVLLYEDTHQVFVQQEVLRQSYLSPPQITQLAQSLVPCGLSGRSLTVEEFCAEYVSP